jgi:hypothetical protein
VLAAFLNVLLNIMLIGSMIGFLACSLWTTLRADTTEERSMRLAALFSGALVVLGAQAAGLGFSQFIVDAMSTSGVAVAAGVVVPAVAGAGLGMLFLRAAYRSNVFLIRIMIFIGMLAAAQFAEIYAQVIEVKGYSLGRAVAPNIAFVVGILLCLVLTYDPKDIRGGPRRFRDLSSGRRPGDAGESPAGPNLPPNGAEPRPSSGMGGR